MFGDAYLTVEEFKARTRSASTTNDDAISAALLSASRQIDGHCGREFNQSESDEYRFFDVPFGTRYWNGFDFGGRGFWGPSPLELGDVVSVTEIASDDGSGDYATAWDVDSYVLYPRNEAIKGKPYREARRTPNGSWAITSYPIRVAGVFGWPAVPDPIKQACFLIANREKSLYDAPFGLSGGGEMGALDMTVSLTPIIKNMLKPYVVRVV